MASSIPPSTGRPEPDAPTAIWSWRALLVLVGAWAFAVTQPLLSVLGAEPGFFLVRRASESAIVVFAVALAVVPPLLLWLVGRITELVDIRLARWYQRLVLVAIVAVAVAPHLVDAGLTAGLLVATVAGLAGGGFALAYERFDAVALWARFTAILPVLAVGAFLVASPTSAILHPSARSSDAGSDGSTRPSVVFLILDELPTASLLDTDGGIDRIRFPNLAALAGDGTWYRNHSAAATTTAQAIPSILTGNGPRDGAPLAATYPDNLFTLLAPTHRLEVSESLTALCPTRLCDVQDRAPAFADQVGSLTADTTGLLLDRIRPVRDPQPAMDDFAETLETLDADEVFGRLVSAPVRFTEFVEHLGGGRAPLDASDPDRALVDRAAVGDGVEPAVSGDPGDGMDPESSSGPGDGVDAAAISFEPGPTDATATDVVPLEVAPVAAASAEEAAAEPDPEPADAVGSVGGTDDEADEPDERPTLSFLHLLLPHGPWRLYPDGQPYATTSYPVGGYDDSSGEPWIKALQQQRHLLQASYADHLVGEIVATLQRTGAYDDSLIVAMADHGVAFRHGSDARLWDDATASDIAYSPLIIKAPGQVRGGPDDRNVTSLDVLPTVADLLGIRVPWATEGAPIDSATVRERGDDKHIVDRGPWDGPAQRTTHDFALSATAPTTGARLIPPASATSAPGGDPFGGPGVLAGLLDPLHVTPWLGARLDDVAGPRADADAAADTSVSATLVAPAPAAEPEGLVRGTVADAPDDATVLVAVDGTVVTAAPLIVLDDQRGTFLALLPPDALLRAVDRSAVELALVTGAGTDEVTVRRIAVRS